MSSEDTVAQATEQSQTAVSLPWRKGSKELEEPKKRTTTTSAEIEYLVMKILFPAMVKAMHSEIAAVFKTFIPIMVEEVKKGLGRNSISRSLPHPMKSSESNSLRLHFVGTLPDTLLTFNKLQGEGASLKVELRDSSDSRVEVGPEASVKIKIFVLDGDFEVEDIDDWTHEDFDKNIAQPRKDKGPLLKGKCEIDMTNGVASVSDIAFTDNSKSMRNGKFRLGARVVKGLPAGVDIRDAVSEAFKVKERRVKFYRKHKCPSLLDGTDCLIHVGKTLCQKLADTEIRTVKDFLQLYHTNANKLQNILQLASNKWLELIKNTKSCSLSDEHYRYYDEASGVEILLNCVFDIVRVVFNGRISQPYSDLDDSQKKQVDEIRLAAYEKRKELPRTYSATIPTSKPADSLCMSVIQHSDMQHLGAAATDTTPPMPSVNRYVNSISEGQDLCIIAPNQTDQEMLPNQTSSGLTAERELLSLMPSEPGMPVDKTQVANSQHQSCVKSPNSSSFECAGADVCMTEQFRLRLASDTQIVLCGSNVPEDLMSQCKTGFKRPRCS